MTSILKTCPIECVLLGFYAALAAKSWAIGDKPRALYWIGAIVLTVAVVWGMVER